VAGGADSLGMDLATGIRVRWALAAAGLAAGVCALWIGLRFFGAEATLYVDDLSTALAAGAAAALCLRAARRHGGRLRLFWGLLGWACAAWTLAETLWAVYDLVLNEPVPVPSWADVGYLSAIPVTVAALLVHPAMHDSAIRRARATIDGLVMATAVAFLGWTVVLGPLWRHSDLSTIGGVVDVAYPFGDIVMLALVVLILRALEPRGRQALWFVLGGILVMAISDSTYTYMTEVKNYASGNMLDEGWIVAYLLVAVGAYCGTRPEELPARAAPDEPPSVVSLVVPYVVVLLALGAAAVEIELGRHLTRVDWYMAMALVLLVLGRQALLVMDSMRLSRAHAGVTAYATLAGMAAPDAGHRSR